MLKKTLAGLGLGLFSLMTVVPLSAQEVATLALRNGERPSGELIDLNASGYTLSIGGQERQFSANDVAAVEFVVGPLPADAQAKVNAGQWVVLLRSGQVIDGRLSDIGGTRPLRVTIDTPSGPREFSSNDIAQAHLFPLNSPAAVGTSGTQSAVASVPAAGTFTVPANQAWTDTGFVVRRGMRLAFTVNGDINLSAGASYETPLAVLPRPLRALAILCRARRQVHSWRRMATTARSLSARGAESRCPTTES